MDDESECSEGGESIKDVLPRVKKFSLEPPKPVFTCEFVVNELGTALFLQQLDCNINKDIFDYDIDESELFNWIRNTEELPTASGYYLCDITIDGCKPDNPDCGDYDMWFEISNISKIGLL